MNPQELQLHDIHIPSDPNAWPFAIGWWILIALALCLLFYICLKIQRLFRIKKHKKLLHQEYSALEGKLQNKPDKDLIAEMNVFLRRLALAFYPNKNIASLTGADWLHFLDTSGKTHDFSRGAGRILIEAPYRSGQLENYNSDEFIPLVRNWVNSTIKKQVNSRAIRLNQQNLTNSKKVGGCL